MNCIEQWAATGSKTGSAFEKLKETNTLPLLRRHTPRLPSSRRWNTIKYTCKGQLFFVTTEDHSFCMMSILLHRPHSPALAGTSHCSYKNCGTSLAVIANISHHILVQGTSAFRILQSSLKHLEILLHSPMSRTLCLAVCCRECQYFQYFSCSSLFLSSLKTTMTTLWENQQQKLH